MDYTVASVNRRQFLTGAMAGSTLFAAGVMAAPSMLNAASAIDGPKPGSPSGPPRGDLIYKTPWGTPTDSEFSPFSLPALPYAQDALAPYISAETLSFHYGKHHQGYVNKLNGQIKNAGYGGKTLENIIIDTVGLPEKTAVFNNAAQAWNHAFYWRSMTPGGGGVPSGGLAKKINSDFGSFDNFKNAFTSAAAGQFGSGWAWLVVENSGLKVVKTANADTPLAHGQVPILTIDVWEHAYYLDYQNRRSDYIVAFLDHLVNWEFAENNYKTA